MTITLKRYVNFCLATVFYAYCLLMVLCPITVNIKRADQKYSSALSSEKHLNKQGQNNLQEASINDQTAKIDYDLSLPGIHQFLPHLASSPSALSPAFKLTSKHNQRMNASMVFGIPTVKREHHSYLKETLKSVISNLSPIERNDCLLVLLIAEADMEAVEKVAEGIRISFNEHIDSGLIEIVSPKKEFYPDFKSLRQTFGDEQERVAWRAKQNLDYAFLMMYSKRRGQFYVQLEDDIITKPRFFSTMITYVQLTSKHNPSWFLIEFCELGFIGKLFQTKDLPIVANFFLMFYFQKPVDWLLDSVVQTLACKPNRDSRMCNAEKKSVWFQYRPSLFQHIGTYSSLKGKVQKMKDGKFGRTQNYRNPAAHIHSDIKQYKGFSLLKVYSGQSFFWGISPQKGNTITWTLKPPVLLEGYRFNSGNPKNPKDTFTDTTCEIYIKENENKLIPVTYARTQDHFVILGRFDQSGKAEGNIDPDWGHVSKFRLRMESSAKNWAILSEIHFIKAL